MQYNLISAVLNSKHKYTRVVNLTGTDYPLYSNEEILKKWSDPSKEWIIGFKIEQNAESSNADKILYYHHMDGSRFLHYLFEAIKINRRTKLRSLGYEFYFGSEYWALTSAALKEIIEYWNNDVRLHDFLKGVFVPSEIWIHTLFFQSQYKDKGIEYKGKYKGLQELSPLTYFQYKDQIKILKKEDYESIIQSHKMFARKIIVGQSDELITLIDKRRNNER